jgi:hypothetical protein
MTDCSVPEIYKMDTPTARKSHRCCECGVVINPGEKYVVCSGVWDGEFSSYKQHAICKEACVWIRDEFQDGECFEFGGLMECYHEHAVPWYGRHENDKYWTAERVQKDKKSSPVKELRHMMAVIFNRQRVSKR